LQQTEGAKTNMKIKSSLLALGTVLALSTPGRAAEITPAEARAIAREACIHGFSPVDNYRVMHAYCRNHP
jgi:hypothetical protein